MTTSLRILVVGTGRCGTGWLADALNRSGISCGHEAIFNHWREDVVQRNLLNTGAAAESAWSAAPFIGRPWLGESIKVVHLVRNPLAVIKSFYDLNFFSQERSEKPLNKLVYENTAVRAEGQDRLFSAVYHYFEWNKLIEDRLRASKNENIMVRLEDLVSDLDERERLQAFLDEEIEFGALRVNERAKEKEPHKSEGFDGVLVREKVLELSASHRSYGYL